MENHHELDSFPVIKDLCDEIDGDIYKYICICDFIPYN